MTALTCSIDITSQRDQRAPGASGARRKRNLIAGFCVAAFIAGCTMPAALWLAQLGLAASSQHPMDRGELPSCAAPDISLQELHQFASASRE